MPTHSTYIQGHVITLRGYHLRDSTNKASQGHVVVEFEPFYDSTSYYDYPRWAKNGED